MSQNVLFDTLEYTKPAPFLKWAGGKRQLLNHIMPLVAKVNFSNYIEVFLGGGAVLWELIHQYKPTYTIANDLNLRLVIAYQVIKTQPLLLIDYLKVLEREYWKLETDTLKRSMFDSKKNQLNRGNVNSIELAGLFIFLNRTGYNGLYRENRAGEFNNSFGGKWKPRIVYEDRIMACHKALENVELFNRKFDDIPLLENSLYYLDPPYVPINDNPHDYIADSFAWEDQERVREYCDRINQQGSRFIASNAHTPEIMELYQGYQIKMVLADRSIASKGVSRSPVSEVLVSNF